MAGDPDPMYVKVRQILSTPLACGKSPAELYFGRNIRCQLDVLRPINHKPKVDHGLKSRQLNVEDRVLSSYYAINWNQWKLGTLLKKLGRLHYIIHLDDQQAEMKRHIDQLRRSEIPKKKVHFAPESEEDDLQPTSIAHSPPNLHDFQPIHDPYSDRTQRGRPSSGLSRTPSPEVPIAGPTTNVRRSSHPGKAHSYLKDYITS
ncbi:uncharacterized protein LOC130441242 [Diorhabda sublineata]|uniref:uncharacterized protein LOC130441242 n=1 Tax=Diorhabda sublineata TaxID=1163346 RepID=UPI0024E04BE5|nr:uncharacterized protein LOC130441242 [Diorhabda sublineata]